MGYESNGRRPGRGDCMTIEELKQRHAKCIKLKEQLEQTFNQVIGQILLLEDLIKREETDMQEKEKEVKTEG